MSILITGGLGYIGSHTVVELISEGYEVVVLDNLSNSSEGVVEKIKEITNSDFVFYKGDVQDKDLLRNIFKENKVDSVIHFAALKSVEDSIKNPIKYYVNNVVATLSLVEVMKELNVKNLIFSSSATVYGKPESLPLFETNSVGLNITNPYGQTKYIIEQMLKDLVNSGDGFNITILRYFNPIGAHESGLIGEDNFTNTPSNLMPYLTGVASGRFEKLNIFGDDYETPDGSAIRDYIHVVDLAKGHISALKKSLENETTALSIYNLGTGKGTSVLELVNAFEKSTGVKVKYEIKERRPGDIASCYADVSKAEKELNWKALKTIEDGCVDAWRWESGNL
jgi:UDP-glucose 4-epimerase